MSYSTEVPVEKVTTFNQVPGWASGKQLELLQDLAKPYRQAVNIGIWKGRTVAALAEVVDSVVAIDHFRGSPSERESNHKQAADDPMSVFYEYYQYMNKLGIWHKITTVISDSVVAAQSLEGPFGLIYLDGSHLYEDVMDDLMAWMPRLAPGGIICGDDFDWDGVNEAVTDYFPAHHPGLIVHTMLDGQFWMVRSYDPTGDLKDIIGYKP